MSTMEEVMSDVTDAIEEVMKQHGIDRNAKVIFHLESEDLEDDGDIALAATGWDATTVIQRLTYLARALQLAEGGELHMDKFVKPRGNAPKEPPVKLIKEWLESAW